MTSKSYWQKGNDDARAGRPAAADSALMPGYRNGFRVGVEKLATPRPIWTEYPVMIDGIPGFCALKVPYGSDETAVVAALRSLPGKGAVRHG